MELLTSGADNKTALLNFLQDLINKSKSQIALDRSLLAANSRAEGTLPSIITFPYSRHSSYAELCHLVDAFKPKDVWPNTVNPREWLEQGMAIPIPNGHHQLLMLGFCQVLPLNTCLESIVLAFHFDTTS